MAMLNNQMVVYNFDISKQLQAIFSPLVVGRQSKSCWCSYLGPPSTVKLCKCNRIGIIYLYVDYIIIIIINNR